MSLCMSEGLPQAESFQSWSIYPIAKPGRVDTYILLVIDRGEDLKILFASACWVVCFCERYSLQLMLRRVYVTDSPSLFYMIFNLLFL